MSDPETLRAEDHPSPSAGDVPKELFFHHLGWPACAEIDEGLEPLFSGARRWYREHGRPWVALRRGVVRSLDRDVVVLEGGVELRSAFVADGLRRAEACALVVVAVSAGPEVDAEVRRLWSSDRPDAAMFLNAYGSAVAEHLRAVEASRIACAARGEELAVLPGYSPGYAGWALADQKSLLACVARAEDARAGDKAELPGPLEVLPSGGLEPSKSSLTVFGLTRRQDLGERLEDFWTCPAQLSREVAGHEARAYSFPRKALERWSRERLRWRALGGERLRAAFRFDGTTCSNMGLELAFDYQIELARDESGMLRIADCQCTAVEGDTGHRGMCAFRADPVRFAAQVRTPPPWLGRALDEVLDSRTEVRPSGCLCTRADREHKWRIVLQTAHFSLTHGGGP